MIHRQRGMTAIGWLIIIGLVGIQAVMALRIVPVYINYGTVETIMDELAEDPEMRGKTPREVRNRLYSRFQINNIYDLQKDKNALKFKPLSDGLQVNLNYEARGPIYGNLEFVATFSHQINIPKR